MHPLVKSLLLIFAIFGPCLSMNGQTYDPFPVTSAAWGQERTLFDPTSNQVERYHYFLNGDTTYNGVVYTKLFWDYGTIFPSLDSTNATLGGAIREDSSQKVYFLNIGTACPFPYLVPQSPLQEYLLYDFGAAVNDTFYTQNALGPLVNVVTGTGVDTLFGVSKRWITLIKGYNTNELYYFDKQYEGIGSEQDLLFPFSTPFEEGYQLKCFEDPSLSWGGCFLASLETGMASGFALQIGPNPVVASSMVAVETTLAGPFDLEIVDLQGKVLLQEKLQKGRHFPIGTQGLPSGMYFVRTSLYGEVIDVDKLLVR